MIYANPNSEGSLVQFKERYENYIGGEWVPPVKGQYLEVKSPVTGKVFTLVARSSEEDIDAIGNGGLSGAPLFERSLERVKYIHQKTEGHLPIIAVGGIMSPEQAQQMLDAGASLVQVYSGFIYNGPSFVKHINKHLVKNLQ